MTLPRFARYSQLASMLAARQSELAFDLLPRDTMKIGSAYDRSGGHTERRLSYRIQEADGPSELVPDLMLRAVRRVLQRRPSDAGAQAHGRGARGCDSTFCRCAASQTVRSRRLFEETAEWFDTSDVSWPFSFENICDALRLEAEDAGCPSLPRQPDIPHARDGEHSVRRRIAGSRHSISGRAPALRHASRFAC